MIDTLERARELHADLAAPVDRLERRIDRTDPHLRPDLGNRGPPDLMDPER